MVAGGSRGARLFDDLDDLNAGTGLLGGIPNVGAIRYSPDGALFAAAHGDMISGRRPGRGILA